MCTADTVRIIYRTYFKLAGAGNALGLSPPVWESDHNTALFISLWAEVGLPVFDLGRGGDRLYLLRSFPGIVVVLSVFRGL